MEMARALQVPHIDDKLLKLKQLAAEESYYGYGTTTENLVLEAFGRKYFYEFGSGLSLCLDDPKFDLEPVMSLVLESTLAVLRQKRYLVLVENLHVPVSLDVLAFLMGKRLSVFQLDTWLISTTSKDVCVKGSYSDTSYWHTLRSNYYHALPFDDLNVHDWVLLIKEALQDAAGSIRNALQHQNKFSTLNKRDDKFWLPVALHCLYYAILYHPLPGSAGLQASSGTISSSSITSDELVRCWVTEDLLFSLTSPTDIPETTGKKQSSYRSAYEAGKVVMQALQEYSLLPIYSISIPTSSTSSTASTSASSPKNAVTGISQLAVGVPRLKQDELFDQGKNSRLRWVSFMNDDGRHISWDWRESQAKFIYGEITMSSLILRGCSNVSTFPFEQVLNHRLRVLDLSYTPINSLPHWFSRLLNLHLLSLRGCSLLKTLSPRPPGSKEKSPPLAHLGQLEVLDMNGVPLVELNEQDGGNKRKLHYLDLSGSRITTLPSEFFIEMTNLEELILGNCSNLQQLPTSLAKLSTLLILHVEGTRITSFQEDMFEAMRRLHTLKLINNMLLMSLPSSLSKANGLKELHICNCNNLRLEFLRELVLCLEDLYIQAWEALEYIKINGHPNLRTFSLSGPWIRCLSLRGCSKLKIVNFSDDLMSLEDVDLSRTAIEEVPHSLPNLPQLRMLLLLNVPYDDKQCPNLSCQQETSADGSSPKKSTINTCDININDSRMFYSFNTDVATQVEKGKLMQSFSVQIKPRSVRGSNPRNKEIEVCTNIHRLLPYGDVHYSEAATIVPMMNLRPRQCHVDISATNQHPNGLRNLLNVTNSIFITDDDSVRCLTDLNYSLMSLEECQLQHCHRMTVVFRMSSEAPGVLPSLRTLQVSNLKNLLSFIDLTKTHTMFSRFPMFSTLKLLKHIHLEHCPRLEKIFPCSLSLPMLESLIILFCPNLKTVFYERSNYAVAPSPLPNIKNIYLQELPQLLHIHENIRFRSKMPKWQELFVRGCQSLRNLPLLKKEYPNSKVKVCGEGDWYDKLHLILPEQHGYYLLVPPQEFALRKKSVIIKSYLR
ncbi:unnamed protein product [Urochloa decumbens]|uniref:Disease resistance R13L4/SHOC-2-like LRR domain-containing protein n=1 Tax=Urochloa decumbens TaxID=240449 RepID=A0ABC9AQN3_9POAL